MVVAGVVVKVVAGQEEFYVDFLKRQAGVLVQGTTAGNIAIVIEAESTGAIEKMSTKWTEKESNILGVFPVYIGKCESEKVVS